MISFPYSPVDVVEYHRAVDICHMRKLMRYDQAAYEDDWNTAIALAQLMATGSKPYFERTLERCMSRIFAYISNNPDARPF